MTTFDHRKMLRAMFDAAVASAQPALCVPRHLPPKPKGRTIVIGAGKASAAMAQALEAHWDGPLEGIVVTRYGYEGGWRCTSVPHRRQQPAGGSQWLGAHRSHRQGVEDCPHPGRARCACKQRRAGKFPNQAEITAQKCLAHLPGRTTCFDDRVEGKDRNAQAFENTPPGFSHPLVLVVTPTPILGVGCFREEFAGGSEKSGKLAEAFSYLAQIPGVQVLHAQNLR